jgi:hypothetical protein
MAYVQFLIRNLTKSAGRIFNDDGPRRVPSSDRAFPFAAALAWSRRYFKARAVRCDHFFFEPTR